MTAPALVLTLDDETRARRLADLDEADVGFVEAMFGRQQLLNPEFDQYLKPTPKPVPPPAPAPSPAERRRDEHLADLFARLERGEVLSDVNPFTNRAVLHLEQLAQVDAVRARAVAIALGQDGTLTDAELDAAFAVTSPPAALLERMEPGEFDEDVREELQWLREQDAEARRDEAQLEERS